MLAITDAVDELARLGSGDVLVFLPGEREIRDAAEALRKHHPPHVEILPLFARLSVQEQERVQDFQCAAHRGWRPTSLKLLTVPVFVTWWMLAWRVKRYSYRNKVEQLQIETSLNQRRINVLVVAAVWRLAFVFVCTMNRISNKDLRSLT